MSNSTYRKVKEYLEILKDQRYDHFRDIVDIRECPAAIKKGTLRPRFRILYRMKKMHSGAAAGTATRGFIFPWTFRRRCGRLRF